VRVDAPASGPVACTSRRPIPSLRALPRPKPRVSSSSAHLAPQRWNTALAAARPLWALSNPAKLPCPPDGSLMRAGRDPAAARFNPGCSTGKRAGTAARGLLAPAAGAVQTPGSNKGQRTGEARGPGATPALTWRAHHTVSALGWRALATPNAPHCYGQGRGPREPSEPKTGVAGRRPCCI
jgi:hypothetical protein